MTALLATGCGGESGTSDSALATQPGPGAPANSPAPPAGAGTDLPTDAPNASNAPPPTSAPQATTPLPSAPTGPEAAQPSDAVPADTPPDDTPTNEATPDATAPAVPTSDTLRGTGQLIGAALNTQFFDDGTYLEVAAREFNYVTAENSMKWDATEPSPGQFTLDRADQIVGFAEANGMQVKGHTLVWHSQLPGWVENLQGAQAVRDAMTNHIQTLMARYRGRVVAWDVVNEAVEDRNSLRSSVFLDNLGETFIDEAFRIARAADPDALLLYNDFGIEGLGGKSDRAFELIQRLVADGVPIDGVGLQMHIDAGNNPSADDIRANIQRYGDLGLTVTLSELDVSVCSTNGSMAAKFDAQGERYREVVRACVGEDNCDGITLWGVTDQYSWLNGSFPCEAGDTGNPWPLVFDDGYQPKPSYQGLLEALSGL